MKKRFKLRDRHGKIHILQWVTDGVLFGPNWESVASFESNESNMTRCKTIVQLMNKCDKHTSHHEDDRKRDK